MENKKFIDELIKLGAIEEIIGKKILQEAALARKPVEELIAERRMISENQLATFKSRILGIPYMPVDSKEIAEDVLKAIPEETVRNYKVIPIELKDDLLVAGMIYPDDYQAQEALKFIAKKERLNLGIYIITPSVWEAVLRRYSPFRSLVDEAIKSISAQPGRSSGANQGIVQLEEKLSGTDEGPVIKIVSSTLKEAVWQKVSDIHIEPQRNRSRIRFRVDGDLQEVASFPIEIHQLIVSRIKILSNLKIDETRIPQDGRFRTFIFGRDIDYRVATFPTPVGEKVVIRVLDPSVGLKGLEDLGVKGKNLEIIKEGIFEPYGMVLITGPTGSGKSTTLYALMQILNKDDINIVSLEDPVEYYMEGLNQSQVKPEIGYDFASGLRQILRQDPDVIMVGEIRDEETAGLAVQAALTGHIVLSTLHTNNSIGVIPRLIDMKVRPFLLPASLNLMVAQRLIPKLCQACKYAEDPLPDVLEIINKEINKLSDDVKKMSNLSLPYKVYKSKGCEVCKGKGVLGRVAIFEILKMTPELEKVISSDLTEGAILKEAERQQMITLRQDGIMKSLEGLVAIEEVLRETAEM